MYLHINMQVCRQLRDKCHRYVKGGTGIEPTTFRLQDTPKIPAGSLWWPNRA